jgi:hypothetical protein
VIARRCRKSRVGRPPPTIVFPEGMTDDECLLAEIQENLARNDLSGASGYGLTQMVTHTNHERTQSRRKITAPPDALLM